MFNIGGTHNCVSVEKQPTTSAFGHHGTCRSKVVIPV